jgi:PAS domain S-box-containing protein
MFQVSESTSCVALLRRASIGVVSGVVAAIVVCVLTGYVVGSPELTGALPGSLPMHPVTAVLMLTAAIGVTLCGVQRKQTIKWRIGFGCSATLIAAGSARIALQLIGHGHLVDSILNPWLLARMPVKFLPRFETSPTSCFDLALLGVALVCLYLRRPRLRFVAYVLICVAALSGAIIISRALFINVIPITAATRTFLMSLPAASSIVLLAGGIALELTNPTRRWPDQFNTMNLIPGIAAKQPSLANKVAIGFGAAVFALCGIGIFSYQSIAEFIEDSHWDNHTYQVLSVIDQLYAEFKDAEGAERGYIITGDPKFLITRQSAIDEIAPAIRKLQFLVRDNTIQEHRLDMLNPLIQQKLEAVQTLTQIRQEKGFDPARQLLSDGPAVRLMDQIRQVLAAMSDEENRLLTLRTIATETNARRGIALISSGAVFSLVLVLAAGWALNRDIGGRERMETALRSSEAMFRGLLQSAPDAMVIADDRGNIKLANTQAEQLFGYSADELIGRHIGLVLSRHGVDAEQAKPSFQFNMPPVGTMGAERDLFGIRSDGSEFPIEMSLSPVNTPTGVYISSAIRDVSLRRKQEQAAEDLNFALRMSNAQLEAANKELEAFSYSVSHDLRAPLRSIDGFSQAILEDYSDKLDSEGHDCLQRVRAASQRMGHLIDDLLNLSRVTRVEINKDTVDLTKVAREIAEDLRNTFPDRDVNFIVAENMSAHTDPRLIRIVITNLMNNAWKFTAKKPEACVEFGFTGTNGSREFFIKDNGAGFDSNYASKLFGAFQRLHSTTEFAGTGIGLATVQRILRRQGGRVRAEGKLNEGAAFYFTL